LISLQCSVQSDVRAAAEAGTGIAEVSHPTWVGVYAIPVLHRIATLKKSLIAEGDGPIERGPAGVIGRALFERGSY
jgi:hypothetical protein